MTIPHPVKPARMWAISHWRGGIYPTTIQQTRRDAIATFQEIYEVDDREWRADRSAGVHRAIPVLVTPIIKARPRP